MSFVIRIDSDTNASINLNKTAICFARSEAANYDWKFLRKAQHFVFTSPAESNHKQKTVELIKLSIVQANRENIRKKVHKSTFCSHCEESHLYLQTSKLCDRKIVLKV